MAAPLLARRGGFCLKQGMKTMMFMTRACAAAFLIACMAALPAEAAGDPVAGKKKALQCQTCHGMDGLSKLPEAPNLAGQIEPYLVKALGDYKSGARKNDMMSIVAPELKDQDMADLAAFFAGLPPQ